MGTFRITIDDRPMEVPEGVSLFPAASCAQLYLPSLCAHPDLPPGRGRKPRSWLPTPSRPAASSTFPRQSPEVVYRGGLALADDGSGSAFEGCRLCWVEADGELVLSCSTPARPGMVVQTATPAVQAARKEHLARILATHPHACLTCAQREGCSRTQCSMNVPVAERCCEKLGHCEVQKVADYIGIPPTTPRYVFRGLPIIKEEPLFAQDYNLCIGCLRCVRVCNDVRGIGALDFVFQQGEVTVGSVGPGLRASGCKFCTACVEVCPTGTLLDQRRAFPVPLYTEGREATLVPCRAACPAGTDVPRYVRLVGEGRYAEAYLVIRERVPFPGVLGHVCFHPCEDACRRGQVNEPIAICALKRYAADRVYEGSSLAGNGGRAIPLVPAPPSGKRVAIVGAGPAGLTAASFLARKGHAVTVFEAQPEAGGMMRYGIPAYRLPREVLDREIAAIVAEGVAIVTNTPIAAPDKLLAEGYHAVFLAVGAQLSRRLSLEGTKLAGVLWGVDFLREVAQGKQKEGNLGQVVVIGGGNVAVDVALTARRLGATDVQMACLESRPEMLAFAWEITIAEEEGVVIHPSWGPQRILGQDGHVVGIELRRCTSVFDSEGRFRPTYDDAVTTVLPADTVILAIGQQVDLAFLGDDSGVRTTGGLLQADRTSLATSVPGLFAGGEAVSGPTSVIEAIAAGRRAAEALDRYLGGDGHIELRLVNVATPSPALGREERFAERPRALMPCLPVAERGQSFAEIEHGFPEAAANAEGLRCLQCDLRLTIAPVVLPPEKWLDFTAERIAALPATEGVYQLLDENKETLMIKGAINLRQALEEQLASRPKARFFLFEENPMYTQRESELLQEHLQKHSRLPEGNDIEDDLF